MPASSERKDFTSFEFPDDILNLPGLWHNQSFLHNQMQHYPFRFELASQGSWIDDPLHFYLEAET